MKVIRKYLLSASGEDFLHSPFTVMSVDPQSNVVDIILGVLQNAPFRESHQNGGKQLKPRVMAALENTWIEGSIEKLKFLGLGLDVQDDICLYFHNCFSLSEATKDPHYLLNVIQFSRTQAGIISIIVHVDGVPTELMANKSYCSGVKMCGGEGCTYTVSTK